jgi:hypothetical protein
VAGRRDGDDSNINEGSSSPNRKLLKHLCVTTPSPVIGYAHLIASEANRPSANPIAQVGEMKESRPPFFASAYQKLGLLILSCVSYSG